jgi:hypothetical protein
MEGKVATWARATARMVVEGTCGAVVGGLVAWYAVGTLEESVAIGALIGAILGFVIGGPRNEPAPKLVAE